MNLRTLGHWCSLALFFGAGVFFVSFFLAWVWPAVFPRHPAMTPSAAFTSLGLGSICLLQFGVLMATRRRRHAPTAPRRFH